MNELYNEDCLKVFKEIEDESVDLCVTDCPYKIVSGGCTTGKFKTPGGMLCKDSDKVDLIALDNLKKGKLFNNNDIKFSDWLPELYRIMKPETHVYIMINARNLKDLQTEAEKTGFKFQNLLVWDKGNAVVNRYYMNAFELVLMLRKGPAKNINEMGTSNLLRIPNIIGNKEHPTEKPIQLMEILINNSSKEGDIVIDPFMGVGATGIACKNLNRNFIGIEIDKKYFDIAKQRIQ